MPCQGLRAPSPRHYAWSATFEKVDETIAKSKCEHPYKSKFELKNNQCKQGANYTLKGFEEEVFFEGDVRIFAEGYDLKMDAEARPTYQKRAKNSTQIDVFNLNTRAYSFGNFKCAECNIFDAFWQGGSI